MDFNGAMANSARQVNQIAEAMEVMKTLGIEEKRKKDLQEEENHDNLGYIAKQSQESIAILKEMNRSLEESLTDITKILQNIFDIESLSAEQQSDFKQQALMLMCEISDTLDNGEKVDWKDKLADGSVQVVLAAIGFLLRAKGINI